VLYELLAGFTPFGGGHPGAVLRRHVTETVVPLPGIPEELWQLLVQCLAKAPASRLRASELGERLREQLPLLAGMPPLDVDEPDGESDGDRDEDAPAAAEPEAPRERVRRGAVPLVPGAKPDSNRDTHTSMRVPGPDELAGGALGTARAPRAAGAPRPGSARHRASARRRRITLGVAGVVLVAAIGGGAWFATSGNDADGSPSDTQTSSPATP
jgi:serine/threonine-protein kinase